MPRVWVLCLIVSLLWLPSASAAPTQTGEQLYLAACATCHGPDGRGAPPEALGFDGVEPPDFSDCNFATREADVDWLGVAHRGGPGRAFAREMASFGAALDRPQLQRILAHIRTFCDDRRWPRGELNFPRPFATEKAFPEDEAVISSSAAIDGPGNIANKFVYEQRFGPRSQFELIVPFGWSETLGPGSGNAWEGGVGDIAVGMKHVMAASFDRGSIVSVAGEIKLPTGSESKGFGSGTTIFEPFVSFGQRLPKRSFVQIQTGAEIPFDRDHSDEGFFRVALGRMFRTQEFGRLWVPMVEFTGGAELDAPSSVHWDVIPQVQVSISTRQHILGCAGVRLPVNDRDDKDPQLVLYLLWDWFDGGLTDGW